MRLDTNETCDTILGGKIRVIQPRIGYRFSLDSILLARFATARSADRVLELGAGCGVISLIIADLAQPREIVAVEIQPALVAMLRRSAGLNGLDSIRAIASDLREVGADVCAFGSFDLVVANPPYRARKSGRESPIEGRRIARTEAIASMDDFVAAAAQYSRHGGRTAFVFLADRFAELITALRAARLEPKRVRFVHPFAGAAATAVMVEARKGGGIGASVEPPLIVYQARGIYTDEARDLLQIA